ncbi:MAG: tetraacyldisaccharide 4'-kinase [Planctomycetaceae bacterium]|nr:tetraacyldisaccharide 4'-kinase [Planctomycetales bacterium]MCB9921160.1 tetraacyldisaccharide 4'-kinase [Planctomycetaceae bacterium]
MFDANYFRAVVSGRQRGLRASILRTGLCVAEPFYRFGVRWRNRQFDVGKREIHRAGVPVISVGNLTVGGTGKTPMVEWLARWFRQRDIRVSLISRGYGAEAGARNDEALELEEKLPDVPHLQNPDRVEAAQMAIDECETQLILLDDAFQHRRIHRDLDIVLIDALEPFGYGHLLPRGLLREPVASLNRADIIALSRSDAVDEATRASIRSKAMKHAPQAAWLEVVHRPQSLLSAAGDELDIRSLQGQRIAAFCGIGNPAGFCHTLDDLGAEVVDLREFPDHHAYQRSDIEELSRWAKDLQVDAVLCTHKDLVKVGVEQLGECPLFALRIGLAITAGECELTRSLDSIAQSIVDASQDASDAV